MDRFVCFFFAMLRNMFLKIVCKWELFDVTSKKKKNNGNMFLNNNFACFLRFDVLFGIQKLAVSINDANGCDT